MRFSSLQSLPTRLWLSLTTLLRFFYFRPPYAFLAVIMSILFYELLFWALNLGLLQYLATNQFLTISDKLGIVIGSYTDVFRFPVVPLAALLFSVSILQGVSIAAIVYIIRRNRRLDRSLFKELGSSGAAGILAAIGLGCAACGTSLVTPILTFLFASSSIAVADTVGIYSALFAVLLSLTAIYLVGLKLTPHL